MSRSSLDLPPSPLSPSQAGPVGVGAGMITRRLVVRAKDVVFVKGVIEAHDGLAHVFAESGGDLTIAAAAGRDAELEELVRDLARELGGIVSDDTTGGGSEQGGANG